MLLCQVHNVELEVNASYPVVKACSLKFVSSGLGMVQNSKESTKTMNCSGLGSSGCTDGQCLVGLSKNESPRRRGPSTTEYFAIAPLTRRLAVVLRTAS
jgi:hypothetical protein